MVEGFLHDAENLNFHDYSVFTIEISLLVIGASRVHPVPSRTRKLSSTAPMVLGGRPPGRVGRRQGVYALLRQGACVSKRKSLNPVERFLFNRLDRQQLADPLV